MEDEENRLERDATKESEDAEDNLESSYRK
jgi:hypothetical protein